MALFSVKSIKKSDKEVADKILQKRLQILVNCCIYYRMGGVKLISNEVFDKLCKELVILQNSYPEVSKRVEWAWAFKNYNGKNNHDLPHNYPQVVQTAEKQVSLR